MDSTSVFQSPTARRVVLHSAICAVMLGLAGPAGAAITSGKYFIINAAASPSTDTTGATATSIKVAGYDATGICTASTTVAYGSSTTISWATGNTHSSTVCVTIATIKVQSQVNSTAGKTAYDSTANTTLSTTGTTEVSFTAPTTATTNETIIVSGNGSPATASGAATATSWSTVASVAPVFSSSNGALTTTGILGIIGARALHARQLMQAYGVTPAKE